MREFDPEVVGLGLRNLHTNAYDGIEATDRGRTPSSSARSEGVTGAPIVLGGAAYSLQPETLLARLGADYGVVGEGERTFRDLVDTLERGGDPPRDRAAGPPPCPAS